MPAGRGLPAEACTGGVLCAAACLTARPPHGRQLDAPQFSARPHARRTAVHCAAAGRRRPSPRGRMLDAAVLRAAVGLTAPSFSPGSTSPALQRRLLFGTFLLQRGHLLDGVADLRVTACSTASLFLIRPDPSN